MLVNVSIERERERENEREDVFLISNADSAVRICRATDFPAAPAGDGDEQPHPSVGSAPAPDAHGADAHMGHHAPLQRQACPRKGLKVTQHRPGSDRSSKRELVVSLVCVIASTPDWVSALAFVTTSPRNRLTHTACETYIIVANPNLNYKW